MDLNNAIKSIEEQIKRFVDEKNAIIGISGGIDSAVVAYLCVRALGKDRVFGLQMPYGDQSTKDGDLIVNQLGISCTWTNIKHAVQSLPMFLPATNENTQANRLINGNMRARIRMTLLYALAGAKNGLVMGTSNATEIQLGYFTKFGDGGCDVEVIGDIYKTEIFEMAKILGVPQSIIDKKPSAELWENQTDEGEIGMTYAEIDKILQHKVTTVGLFLNEFGENGRKIMERAASTNHKRNMPPTFIVRQ
jgi:NAD+ synthase